ncbi:amidohydrolase family protein [Mycobacterium sp. CVI_P3]|uniref:Amidohydrolase family protein n=1 Tax=Mycobacterium pinniadriaticum TaxID=2994102 RepID=A0ABT3SF39_9MYCO|nr:amidohydrolase family protein [Mycobacterium pinniadriaticum]MCX2931796.1 amidohydrolase family protein [Mycobacterium pinniadriaticum]MCX2938129.1 amidohydrolase family protein [Mycobacterium pinniadriaticum]
MAVPMFDADQHYYETDDAFTRYLPKQFLDENRAVRVVRTPDRPEGRIFFGEDKVTFFGVNPVDAIGWPGQLLEYFKQGGGKGDAVTGNVRADDIPESRHRDLRLRWMVEHGVVGTLMFPTTAVGVEYQLQCDVPALNATLTAFNRWIEEEWGFGSPESPIYSAPLLNLTDIDWAVAELERVIAQGAKLVHLRPGPVGGKRSPADPAHDGFWARCAEAEIPVDFHLGNSGESVYYSALWGETPSAPQHRFSPFQRVTSFGERAISDTLLALVTHNLFGRVPNLTVMSIEHGSEWVGPLLKKMDRAARMCGPKDWTYGVLTERPREIFKRHVKVAPFPEDNILGLIELIGEDAVVAGSDWPHPEGEVVPLDFAARIEGKVPDHTYLKVMHDNVAKVLGLPALQTASAVTTDVQPN